MRVLACTHTGLPYAQDYEVDGQRHVVINNGAAGLPDFHDRSEGVVTRLSTQPLTPSDSLYGTTLDGVRCDALPLRYDAVAWRNQFLAAWPPGSPAHTSYAARVTHGTVKQSARGTIEVSHCGRGADSAHTRGPQADAPPQGPVRTRRRIGRGRPSEDLHLRA